MSKHEQCPCPEEEHDGWCNWCEAGELRDRIDALTAELASVKQQGLDGIRAVEEAGRAEVARLREELEESRAGFFNAHEAIMALTRDLATERAGREKAESKARTLEADLDAQRYALTEAQSCQKQAERERDAALVQQKVEERGRLRAERERDAALAELDAALADRDTHLQSAVAAESALASTRELLESAPRYIGHIEAATLIANLRKTLSSAPSPAPCSGCAFLKELYEELEDRGGTITRKTWNRLEALVKHE